MQKKSPVSVEKRPVFDQAMTEKQKTSADLGYLEHFKLLCTGLARREDICQHSR